MNTDFPTDPREALEASLTALLLDELPADQAAFLRDALARDPELAKRYQRLKHTIDLVRTTAKTPTEEINGPSPGLKLSQHRREELLQHFKTVAPGEFEQAWRSINSWLVPLSVAALVMVLCGALLLPALSKSKARSMASARLSEPRDMLRSINPSNLHLTHGIAPPAPQQQAQSVLPATPLGVERVQRSGTPNIQTQIVLPPDPLAEAARTAGQLEQHERLVSYSLLQTSGQLAPLPKQEPQPPAPSEIAASGGGGLAGGGPVPELKLAYAPGDLSLAAADQSSHYRLITGGPGEARSKETGQTEKEETMLVNPTTGLPIQAGKPFDVVSGSSLSNVQWDGFALRPSGTISRQENETSFSQDGRTIVSGIPWETNATFRGFYETQAKPANNAVASAPEERGDQTVTIGGRAELAQQARQFKSPEPAPSAVPQMRARMLSDEAKQELGRTEKPIDDNLRKKNEEQTAVERSVWLMAKADSPRPSLAELDKEIKDAKTKERAELNARLQVPAEQAAKEPSQEVLISTFMIAPTDLPELENKRKLSNSLPELPAQSEQTVGPTLLAENRDQPQRKVSDGVTGASPQNLLQAEQLSRLAKVEALADSSLPPPMPRTGSLNQVLGDLKSSGDKDERINLYAAKKRELEEDLKLRQALSAKIITEGADVELPKSISVTLFDKALPGTLEKPGLLDRIRGKSKGEFKSVARINVDRDGSKNAPAAYDPYFPQTEYEVIQSERVLKQVIKDLDLNKMWAEEKGASQELNSEETLQRLRKSLQLRVVPNTDLIEIGVTSDKPEQAANIANAIAQAYRNYRQEVAGRLTPGGIEALKGQLREQDQKIALAQRELQELEKNTKASDLDDNATKTLVPPSIPQPEIKTSENTFSTFSLNVSDVSFKLAAASLEKGTMPDAAGIRVEEFINAFDYRDPEPAPSVPIGFTWERAQYPFAQNRDLLRFSLKTAAQGRQAGRPLNLVLLLDNSGSMERADRVSIIREALRVLAAQLQPQDTFSVVTFARTARLWVDGIPGNQAGKVAEELSGLTPQGGTNLEEAMNLAYQTALRHYLPNGGNRVVLLTDGAANLGNVDPESLKQKVETNRKQGIVFDCFGIGWEGYNDDLLEVLTRNGDGRYGFINTPEEAASGFANQLAGALHVAAADVKVQVEFNPNRVTAYRQIGYAKHQLTKEQFRDNTVDAAELGAAESGNALYVVQVNPNGEGPIATVRVRYKVPGTTEFHEHEWPVPYTASTVSLQQSSAALRLAATASAFGEWLSTSPYAIEVTLDALLGYLNGIAEIYGADTRPKTLEWMIRQAKSLSGK